MHLPAAPQPVRERAEAHRAMCEARQRFVQAWRAFCAAHTADEIEAERVATGNQLLYLAMPEFRQ